MEQDPQFRAQRNRLRSAAIEATRDNLRWLATEATKVLRAGLDASQASAIRLRAATQILDMVMKDADKVGGFTPEEVGYDEVYENLRKYPPRL